MVSTPDWLPRRGWVVFILAISLLSRLVIATFLHPGFDEAYYYLYTLHPDWSFFDHPLLVGWATGFGVWLTGQVNQLTIRLGPIFLFTGSLILIYRAAARLFNLPTALATLALAAGIPAFPVMFGTLTLPDAPLIFFWSAGLEVAAREFFPPYSPDRTSPEDPPPAQYRPTWRLVLLCTLVGLSCLGKYHGLALGFGLICFCLLSPPHRRVFGSGWLPLGVLAFALTLFPILYWNGHHEWISLKFQSSRSLEGSGFNGLGVLLVIAQHWATLFFTFGIAMVVAVGHSIARVYQGWIRSWQDPALLGADPQGDRWQRDLLLLCMSLPLIGVFTWMGGYRQILISWPLPGFWPLTIVLGERAVGWYAQTPRRILAWFGGTVGVFYLLVIISLVHIAGGWLQKPNHLSPATGIWPIAKDASTQLVDVRQLRRAFQESDRLHNALQNSAFVFTNHYFLGGQLAMALFPLAEKPITCLAEDIRGFAFWSRPDQWLGQDALYISSAYFQQGMDPVQQYQEYFRSFEVLAEIPVYRAGEVIQTFYVYQAKTQLKPYPRPYGIGATGRLGSGS